MRKRWWASDAEASHDLARRHQGIKAPRHQEESTPRLSPSSREQRRMGPGRVNRVPLRHPKRTRSDSEESAPTSRAREEAGVGRSKHHIAFKFSAIIRDKKRRFSEVYDSSGTRRSHKLGSTMNTSDDSQPSSGPSFSVTAVNFTYSPSSQHDRRDSVPNQIQSLCLLCGRCRGVFQADRNQVVRSSTHWSLTCPHCGHADSIGLADITRHES